MENHRRVVGVCLLAGLALTGLIGCGKQPIAVVGQSKITRDEFLAKLEKEAGRQALTSMIDQKLMEDAFAASGLTLADKELQDRMDEIKKQFPSPEEFAKALKAQNMTELEAQERIKLQMQVQKLCTKDVKVNEADLKKFFEQNQQGFSRPEMIGYSEIVMANEAEAKKVADELKKPKADFGALAKQHSLSPMSREQGGKVQPGPREMISPEVVKTTVLSLKPGETSAPFKVDDRFYIVRLDSMQAATKADFVKDRAKVEEAFKMQSAKQPQELLTELRQKAVINVVDPKYQDLNDVFKPQAAPEFGTTGPQSQGGAAPAGQPQGGQAPAGGR